MRRMSRACPGQGRQYPKMNTRQDFLWMARPELAGAGRGGRGMPSEGFRVSHLHGRRRGERGLTDRQA